MTATNSARLGEARVERCGIVLAGGEGMRVRSLATRLTGQPIPKQYVNFVGTRSMLEHTFQRAEKLIPSDRLFTVASRGHLEHHAARRQLAARPAGTVVLQPENRDTAPGLLLPLMHLAARHPRAVVAVFPADHYILEEDLFMAHVELALSAVEIDESRLVLLGVQPGEPEPDYGYILPGAAAGSLGLRSVSRFIEKPARHVAAELALRGGLWNTLVMAFRAGALLELARSLAPDLAGAFERIGEAIGTLREQEVTREVYRSLRPLNLSRDLLENLPARHPSRLLVLSVHGVHWSDWGSEQRVLGAMAAASARGAHREAPTQAPPVAARSGALTSHNA